MMRHRTILVSVCLLLVPAAFGQKVAPNSARDVSAGSAEDARPVSVRPAGPRQVTKTEGRQILATISSVDPDSDDLGDCSHLVHDLYAQAGFPYDYASSRELYMGSTNFTRVRVPQPGDLIVWRGHVGIVIDPKEHSFFSFTRSGPDTQFYDSPYWRSRGIARFYRYMTEKPLHPGRTLEASRHADQEPVPAAGRTSPNRPPSKSSKTAPARTATTTTSAATDASREDDAEPAREIVLQVAGKNPVPDEIAEAFVEMNQDSGEALRAGAPASSKPVIVYRQLRVSAVQIKGKHGTALARVESLGTLGALPSYPASPQPRWKEVSLEFEKTKQGWVMVPVIQAAYVPREVALQILSARLAALSQNADATPEQERERKQIIRFLNLLVPEDSGATSAQSN